MFYDDQELGIKMQCDLLPILVHQINLSSITWNARMRRGSPALLKSPNRLSVLGLALNWPLLTSPAFLCTTSNCFLVTYDRRVATDNTPLP